MYVYNISWHITSQWHKQGPSKLISKDTTLSCQQLVLKDMWKVTNISYSQLLSDRCQITLSAYWFFCHSRAWA